MNEHDDEQEGVGAAFWLVVFAVAGLGLLVGVVLTALGF